VEVEVGKTVETIVFKVPVLKQEKLLQKPTSLGVGYLRVAPGDSRSLKSCLAVSRVIDIKVQKS
jgi:hypothetical protein